MPVEKNAPRKLPVTRLVVGAALLAGAAIFLIRGVNLTALVEQGMAVIRGVGPALFFLAMAVLPSAGVPITVFTITAGEAFAPQLGLGWVITLALAALAVNLALTYWLARYALRPLLTRLLGRYGYTIPQVTRSTALAVTAVTRLAPGLPYAVQGYVLGIAGVPFMLYMIVSWLAQSLWAVGFIVLGQGLLKGNFGVAAKGLGVIVVAAVIIHFVRKKFAKREG